MPFLPKRGGGGGNVGQTRGAPKGAAVVVVVGGVFLGTVVGALVKIETGATWTGASMGDVTGVSVSGAIWTGVAVVVLLYGAETTGAILGASVAEAEMGASKARETGANVPATLMGLANMGAAVGIAGRGGIIGGAMGGGAGLADLRDCHHLRNDWKSEPRKRGDNLASAAAALPLAVEAVPLIVNDGVLVSKPT
jgi:hypothetical protein